MGLKIENIINLTDYSNNESFESANDRNKINMMKNQALKILNKNDVILALEEIKKIITSNKNNLDNSLQNIRISQSVIKKEIDRLEGPNTLDTLYASNIDQQILSICVTQYNIYYARIQELNYRLNILSYKTVFIEQQQKIDDSNIDLINKYIIALKEL